MLFQSRYFIATGSFLKVALMTFSLKPNELHNPANCLSGTIFMSVCYLKASNAVAPMDMYFTIIVAPEMFLLYIKKVNCA